MPMLPEVESSRRLPPLQRAVAEGRAQDVERRAVFDRAAGVEPLRLGEDLHTGRQVRPDPAQRQQRGIAHRGFQPAHFGRSDR